MFRKKYANLLTNLSKAQPLVYGFHENQMTMRLLAAREELSRLHTQSVADYLKRYSRKYAADLIKIIRENRINITSPSLLNVVQIAKLHAAEMRLHPAFSAVVLVDRGVYAAKAIRIAKQKGYRTILICEHDEETSLAANLADHVLEVKDLNNVDEIMQTTKNFRDQVLGISSYRFGFDPGFGVLSENPALPAACVKNGFIFIGPAANPMRIMGDKTMVKAMALRCNVPVIPGYTGEKQDLETLLNEAQIIGYPIMMKKARGGGGTGNRIVKDSLALEAALHDLRNSNKDEVIFLEKYLPVTRHIEVQTFFGKDAAIELGTRDCSLQRKYQKFIEMAPGIDQGHLLAKVKQRASVLMSEMQAVGYQGPATLEFLVAYDEENKSFKEYFLEINPRIQVEHGVTEQTRNIDLIALKFWVASGRSIKSFMRHSMYAHDLKITPGMMVEEMVDALHKNAENKFAIQARIENVDFEKSIDGIEHKVAAKGTVEFISMDPSIDCGITAGTKLYNSSKNPLIATPIGVGSTYHEALKDLLGKLQTMEIVGVNTNIARQISNVCYLLANPELIANSTTVNNMDVIWCEASNQPVKKTLLFTLFDNSKAFETGKNRLPVKRYEPQPGRSGYHD